MHVLCPHCFAPLSVEGSGSTADLVCPSCGSTIPLERGSTIDWSAAKGRQTMGRFVLDGLLGSGGFGTVYRARDPELDRFVALKVPRTSQLESTEQIDRFLREARSVAQLRHPGIVPVFEVGQADDVPYLVSQLVPGVSLADELSRRRLPPREAAALLAAVADALAYAHAQGVVHRDVKPSNILLGEGSTPFLTDFGLAKRDAGEITVTQDGQVLGTPAYMSPEQARGEAHRVDGRSDVYSLGVILYHMLTGELPFRGTQRMILHQVLHDEPRPPRRLNDRIPRDLETVCLQAMAKEAGRRYAGAAELAEDLRRFLAGQPVKARPVGRLGKAWRWCRRNPLLAAASGTAAVALVAGTVVSVLFALYQAHAAEREARDADDLRAKEKQLKETADDLRLQTAEKTNALKESEERGQKLRRESAARRKLLEQSARMARRRGLDLCGGGQVQEGILWLTRALELAPDEERDLQKTIRSDLAHWRTEAPVLCGLLAPGEAISFAGALAVSRQRRHRKFVRLIDPRTNKLLAPPVWWDSAWSLSLYPPSEPQSFSPDGKRLLLGQGKEVRIWDLADAARPVFVLPHVSAVSLAAWSPDAQRLVTVSFGGQPPRGRVHLWDLHSQKRPPVPLTLESEVGGSPSFSPDGKALVLATARGYEVVDAAGGKRLGVLTGSRNPAGTLAATFSFTPDSRTLAVQDYTGVRLWDLTTRERLGSLWQPSPQAVFNTYPLTFRPDGKVLFRRWHSYQGASRVEAWDVAASRPFQPPWMADKDRPDQALSANGACLASWSRQTQKAADVVIHDTSTGQVLGKPIAHDRGILRVAFSPDGRRLLTMTDDHKVRFWSPHRGVADGAVIHLGPVASFDEPSFGPRGQTIGAGYQGGTQIWDVATGRRLGPPPATGTVLQPSPDERTLLVQSSEQISHDLLRDARTLRPLRHDPALRTWAVSPDGRRAMMVRDAEDGTAAHAVLVRTDDFKPVGPPLPHPHGCSATTFSPDGKVVLTQVPGGTARLWDAATASPRGDPIKGTSGADFTPDSRSVWIIAGDRLEVRATATGRLVGEAKPAEAIKAVLPAPDSQSVLTCGNNQCFLWDASGRRLGEALPLPRGAPRPVFSPDGHLLAYVDQGVRVRDTRTGRTFEWVLEHDDTVRAIEFSPDGAYLLTQSAVPLGKGRETTRLHVWEMETGRLVRQTELGPHTAWAFSPSGDRVVLSTGTEVQLVHLRVARLPAASLRHVRMVSSVSFSPDGSRILTVSTNTGGVLREKGWGEARLWDGPGQHVGDPLVHTDRITAALFSPDSQTILTTSHDGTARLWDAQTGRCLGGPLLHGEQVNGARFSPDGRSFATWAGPDWTGLRETRLWERPSGSVTLRPASGEAAAVTPDGAWQLKRRFKGRVYSLWDALTGKPLGPPLRETRPAQHVWVSPDGKRLLAVHRSDAQLWDTAKGEAVGPVLRHAQALFWAAFSPDSGLVATASDEGVRLWEADTGKPHGRPLPHPQGCRWLAFSSKGDALVTAGVDAGRVALQTFRLWDPATGKLRCEPWSGSTQLFPDFSPDGRFLVCSTNDLSVLIKDVKTGKEIGKVGGETGKLSPDGKFVAVATRAGFRRACQLWEVETGKKLGELLLEETASEWSPDGKRLLTLSADGQMRCWDIATRRPVGRPFRHAEAIRFGVFSADGRDVWTFNTRQARCWDAATGAARGDPLVFPAGVQWPYLSPDKRAVLLSLGDGFTAWDLQTRKPLYAPVKVKQIAPGPGSFGWLQFPSSRYVQAAHDDYTAELLDVAAGRPLGKELPLDWWPQRGDMFAPLQMPFDVSPDRSTFFAPADAQTLTLYDAATGEAFGSPPRHSGAVGRADYSPDGRTLLTRSGTEVRLWRISTGKVLAAWQVGWGPWPLAFSPDSKLLVTGPAAPGREELCLWDTNTGKAVAAPLPHPGPVTLLPFSPDGKYFASAAGNQLRVWDAATRRLLWGPREHGGELTGLAFSLDGRVLAALGGPVTRGAVTHAGQKAWLWEAATGRPIGEPLTHTVSVTSVHFSPAGDIALVGNVNPYPRPFVIPAGEFQVWDTRSGARKARLVHAKAVRALAFRPDGAYVATLDLDGVVRLWRAGSWECVGETPPHKLDFQHGVSLLFGADGRSVIAADGSGARRVWRPPYPLEGTPAALRAEAELRTGLSLDDEGVAHLLPAADWEGRHGK